MKRTALFAIVVSLAAGVVTAPPASAYGKPSASKAASVTRKEVRRQYRSLLREFPDAYVMVDCRLKRTLKGERRYKCDYLVSLGFDGGYYGVESPEGFAWTYWYRNKPWAVVLF